MDAYTDFAYVYDTFMDNAPYEEWQNILLKILKSHGISRGLLLDLGCGTGTLTELLAAQGYDMIGVDASEEMLEVALEKKAESGHDILYLQQDMREFELYGTVAGIVCVCDSINYLLEDEDIIRTFQLVNNYLDPEGLFIFDFNTVYKYKEVIGETTIAENREDCSFIWDNYYHEKEAVNEYELTFFVKAGEEKGEKRFRRFEEVHYQRGYTFPEMKRLLEEAGLILLSATDADTGKEVSDRTERVLMVAREHGKAGKQTERDNEI